LEEYSLFIDDYIGRVHETCPEVDAILVHDDWCHANGPFFSEQVARDLLLPHKKRLVESCHKRGLYSAMACTGATSFRGERHRRQMPATARITMRKAIA